VGDRAGVATTLNNIGAVYHSISQPQEALKYYNQALPIVREVGDRAGVATTLNNIGAVYSSISHPRSIEILQPSFTDFARSGRVAQGVATTLIILVQSTTAFLNPKKH
jgi:tetratricopeptide (TPR) repeat protein